ncbi:AfsR/SARP family transcriptional regulator, partial [Streptomyces sp. NPDC054841]
MTYRYRVLGAVQVLRPDGSEVPLSGARLRALLTVLAAAGGRAVRAGELIDEVWGGDEEPPADTTAALQALVGRLRRALGRDAIGSVPGGYRLAAGPDAIDVYRFERLVAQGTEALRDGDPGRAAHLLDEALALWRGPALADLPGRDGDPVAVRAGRRLAEAHRARLTAEVALGRPDAALPGLAELATAQPLDETVHALLIRALRAAGRPAEALQAYEDIRMVLADRLGTDPGPELQSLHQELLSPPRRPAPGGPSRGQTVREPAGRGGEGGDPMARSVLEPTASWPAAGRTGTTAQPSVTGRAERAERSGRVEQSERPGPGANAGPAGTAAADDAGRAVAGRPARTRPPGPAEPPVAAGHPPGNLRARLTSFVGRERELDSLRAELGTHRLVTLVGAGGVGKTRLSLEAADDAQGAADGVWLVELAPVRAEESVPEAVLTVLGARETQVRGPGSAQAAAREPLARVVELCGARRMLLVVDNCEHVIGAVAELVETVLTSCPGVTVLATSREPLGVPGETVRTVDPLPQDGALRLLAERGAAARAGFRTDEDPEACAEICRRLDGLPLAVELAAARLRALSPRQIADRLDDRFRLLSTGGRTSRTVLPRQQTLRAVVDWSWDLLDTPERAVLRRLSVFSGGCALEQADAVCADTPDTLDTPDTPDPRHVAEVLASLVDKSLVVAGADGSAGNMRYRLLETVAEYAASRLDEAGERDAVERRHLVAYRELVRTGDPRLRGTHQTEWLRRFETEHDNVRAALRTSVARREEQEGLCLTLSMSWFWQLRNHQADARTWAAAVASLGPDPFAAPVRRAVALPDRCTDTPPPWDEEQLWEARRGVRLLVLAAGDAAAYEGAAYDAAAYEGAGHGAAYADTASEGAGPAGDTPAQLGAVVSAYRPGLPQNCRQPGSMWY